MVELRDDLRLALDRVSFAKELGIVPDGWQEDLLRSTSNRTLLNCCRQSGKSTMAALIGLHKALYRDGSLVLILAPAERQAQYLGQAVSCRGVGEKVWKVRTSRTFTTEHRMHPKPSTPKLRRS
jgi:hypothetical protein